MELRKSSQHLQQEQQDIATSEQAIAEKKVQLNTEKQKLSEEKRRLQSKIESLQQEVLQLTRAKESLEEEIDQLNTSRSALLEERAAIVKDQVTAETDLCRPRTSTPARHIENPKVNRNEECDDDQEESQVHDGPVSQEGAMHMGELAAIETVSSYGVAGVSTVLAEKTEEKTLEEQMKQQRKGGSMSKSRQRKRQTEPVKKQTEPIQELAARLAALTSKARGSGQQSTRLHQPATVDLPMSEAEGTVDSYLSSLASIPTRDILAGNFDGDTEYVETQYRHPRPKDVLDNVALTESSESDHDSDDSETPGRQRVNARPLNKGYRRFLTREKIRHETRDIMTSLRQVNDELTSVLARLPPTETNAVPPPVRMAWTDRNYGYQTRYPIPDPNDINRRRQKYLGDSLELSRKPAIHRGTTSSWDDSSLRRTLLMLEEQKRWLEEYRQTISPQKPVLSMSSGHEEVASTFTSLNDLRHTVNSGLGVGAASRHWSARLELGDSGEIHRVPGVARTSSKWNRRF